MTVKCVYYTLCVYMDRVYTHLYITLSTRLQLNIYIYVYAHTTCIYITLPSFLQLFMYIYLNTHTRFNTHAFKLSYIKCLIYQF